MANRHQKVYREVINDDYDSDDLGTSFSPSSSPMDHFYFRRDQQGSTTLSSFFPTSPEPQRNQPPSDPKLDACYDKVRSVLGDDFGVEDDAIVAAILDHNYDLQRTISFLLGDEPPSSAKPAATSSNPRSTSDFLEMFPAGNEAFRQKKSTPIPSANPSISSNNSSTNAASGQLPKQPSQSTMNDGRTLSTLTEGKGKSPAVVSPSHSNPTSNNSSIELNDSISELSIDPSKSDKEKQEKLRQEKERRLKDLKQTTAPKKKELEEKLKKREETEKGCLNLIVIGHVDAGKSTLMGHLLYLNGNVNSKTMHKYETESKKIGKSSFSYAWVLDEDTEERAKGVTMDVALAHFETPKRSITLLDAPGHRDFVPNMITGASQADAAILVLNATEGEFETGFDSDGQTKEHAQLAKSLGVSQLIVAINQLDKVEWSQTRYNSIVDTIKKFLRSLNFPEKTTYFVPVSGFFGVNLLPSSLPSTPALPPALSSWYSGPSLVDIVDELKPPERALNKAFRMCVSDVYKSPVIGMAVSGKIESGFVAPGNSLLLMPLFEACSVKNVRFKDENVGFAGAGDNAELGISDIDISSLSRGSVLCDPQSRIPICTRFKATIIAFALQFPITQGKSVIVHAHGTEVPAKLKLLALVHKDKGTVIRKNPKLIRDREAASVEIFTQKKLCLELFSDYKQLGRILLRADGRTIAAGVVTELINPT